MSKPNTTPKYGTIELIQPNAIVNVRKTDGTMHLRIPRDIVKKWGLKEGSPFYFFVDESQGTLAYKQVK